MRFLGERPTVEDVVSKVSVLSFDNDTIISYRNYLGKSTTRETNDSSTTNDTTLRSETLAKEPGHTAPSRRAASHNASRTSYQVSPGTPQHGRRGGLRREQYTIVHSDEGKRHTAKMADELCGVYVGFRLHFRFCYRHL